MVRLCIASPPCPSVTEIVNFIFSLRQILSKDIIVVNVAMVSYKPELCNTLRYKLEYNTIRKINPETPHIKTFRT